MAEGRPLLFVDQRLIDHHCHGVITSDVDRAGFEALMNEGPGPSSLVSTLFDSMLGLAVRRWCAPILDLEPLADADVYLDRRRELGPDEVNRRFISAADVSDLIVDTGFDPDSLTDPTQTAAYGGARGHEIVRLETLGQELLAGGVGAPGFAEAVRERITTGTYVGAKSIAAYRGGLALPADKPGPDALGRALDEVAAREDGFRIVHPVVSGWLAYTAIEAELPLQFHVGYGDNDVNLADCDPLLLTGFLRATQDRDVPVLLLHNYPFHRHASYLAQVFGHVFMDVGLTTHNTGALSSAIIRESLELVPFAKMVYSSDAFGLSELYYLGATLFRRGLGDVLQSLVDDHEMGESDARHIAMLIGRDNARRAYGLA